MSFQFECATCGEVHHGMPSFGADAPLSYFAIPEKERALRCNLGTNDCVIDQEHYFVRGNLEISVHGQEEPFSWGVWVSLSENSYLEWTSLFDAEKRSDHGPYFGWLNAWLKPYPETMNLKTKVHLRDHGVRPYIELEPTEHPLAMEQGAGIDSNRVAEIYSMMVHGDDA